MSAILDSEQKLEALLSPAAERDIDTALSLLDTGSDRRTALRILYCLARMDGMTTMAKVGK